ncbi:class I SAM-dependent methyltransferase [Hydrogenophaga sp. UC242_53]|uniref:class I SAM-dependent methyltransferase n=1 Tax=Hydrogenophaga sp. UC242_53 TaxID=3350170 RepID=UPI0036D212CD
MRALRGHLSVPRTPALARGRTRRVRTAPQHRRRRGLPRLPGPGAQHRCCSAWRPGAAGSTTAAAPARCWPTCCARPATRWPCTTRSSTPTRAHWPPPHDFITCTEVAEHFHDPAAEFRRLDALLRPGGWLALMTRFQTDDARFAQWHYRRDPTHVVFYREATLRWLARHHGWHCEVPGANVVLMQKRPAPA